MPLIEAITFIVVGAATLALAAMIVIVSIGVRREERRMTMTRNSAPGPAAWLTRRIVGLYVRQTDRDHARNVGGRH
jgi:hypothetical protein